MNWFENLRRSFLDWEAMAEVLPNMIMVGLKNTLILASASTVLGIVIGMVLAVMGISHPSWLRIPARIYTDIFRGLPAIVTILLIGQGFARIGRDLFGPSPYPLGILALSLIAGAYIGEIFRAGIQSVERGQMEASRALSMSYGQGMRLVVIPQGIRRVLPALVNQFIGNVKDSSLGLFPGPAGLGTRALPCRPGPAVVTGNLSPLLLAGIFYLVITVPLTHLVNYIDYRLRTGKRPTAVTSGLKEVSEMEEAGIVPNTAGVLASADKRLTAIPALARVLQSRCVTRAEASRSRTSTWPMALQGASRCQSHGEAGYGDLHHRSVGVGQVDTAALPQSAGGTLRRRHPARWREHLQVKPEHLRRRVGMVFQQFNLFPDHTALDNVTLALTQGKAHAEGSGRGDRRGTACRGRDWRSGSTIGRRTSPAASSSVSRSPVRWPWSPEVMLFDEVTSALDPELVKGVLKLMADWAERGMTMVVVTHEMNFARKVADQVVFMDEGRVVEAGRPDDLFDNPQSSRLKRFLSQVL